MEKTTNEALKILENSLLEKIERAEKWVEQTQVDVASLRKNANEQKVKDRKHALQYALENLQKAKDRLTQFQKMESFISELDGIENIISDYVGKKNSIYDKIGDRATLLWLDFQQAKRDGFININ